MGYEAFYFNEFPSRDDVLRQGARWLLETAVQNGLEPVVVAPTKNHYRDNNVLKSLATHARAESAATLKKASWFKPCAVLVAWPDQETLRVLDGTINLRALCVVPWIEQDVATWLSARQPTDLLGKAAPTAPRLDPVVEVALEHLGHRVNLSTGITHPSDRDAAVLTFRELRRAGYVASQQDYRGVGARSWLDAEWCQGSSGEGREDLEWRPCSSEVRGKPS